MRRSTVLITGASGLIGHEVIQQLIQENTSEVRALDIHKTPDPQPGVDYFAGDVNNPSESLFEGVDTVIHLASPMGVDYTEGNPLQTIETIVNGTGRILALSNKHKISRFIMTSSSEVYGDASSGALSEKSAVSPKSVYGSAKLTAEYLCRAYQKEYGLASTILRIFNAFGNRQSHKFVIPLFIEKAIKNEPLEVFGDGRQTRSFCHVSDAARFIIRIMNNDSAKNNIYNVGDPRNNISMLDLAAAIKELVGNCKSEIEIVPLRAMSGRNAAREIRHRLPDISAIQTVTGYQPLEDFMQKLAEIIDYKRERMEKIAAV